MAEPPEYRFTYAYDVERYFRTDGTEVSDVHTELNRLASQLSASQASGERWRKALAELVACKALKDSIADISDPDDRDEAHREYAMRKDAAWNEARAALEQA